MFIVTISIIIIAFFITKVYIKKNKFEQNYDKKESIVLQNPSDDTGKFREASYNENDDQNNK
jgi:hypothetical protein